MIRAIIPLVVMVAGSALANAPAAPGAGSDLQPAIEACLGAVATARRTASAAGAGDDLPEPKAFLDRAARVAPLNETSCIGYASALCMSQDEDGSSTLGAAACLRREADAWNTRLNAAYLRILAKAATPAAADAYRRAERAWMAYRDATCRIPASRLGTHDRVVPLTSNCLLDLTARQALHLQDEIAALD